MDIRYKKVGGGFGVGRGLRMVVALHRASALHDEHRRLSWRVGAR